LSDCLIDWQIWLTKIIMRICFSEYKYACQFKQYSSNTSWACQSILKVISKYFQVPSSPFPVPRFPTNLINSMQFNSNTSSHVTPQNIKSLSNQIISYHMTSIIWANDQSIAATVFILVFVWFLC
jgi:hypothetical protein